MSSIIVVLIVGVFQEDNKFFVRAIPERQPDVEIEVPITAAQFHSMPIGKPAKITIGFIV